ncbi:MAG: GNAT family N-acetyltransferase [Candidatus Omnitrophica bacterium]|nr:GNAT family N-acetyltransferase [Candidatus Omnitrophota bacterium]
MLKKSVWDSGFFRRKIASIENSEKPLGIKAMRRLLDSAGRKKFECLYLQLPYDCPDLSRYFPKAGFVLADIRLVLVKKLRGCDHLPDGCLRRLKEGSYYPFLKTIARGLSSFSRFANDPGFGIMQARRLYEEWLRKSFYGKFCDDFLIYLKKRRPAGFITIRIKKGVPFIDLLGVGEEARGRGAGSALVEGVECKLYRQKYRILKVVTQARNYQAVGFYLKNGFSLEKVSFFYHIWLKKT